MLSSHDRISTPSRRRRDCWKQTRYVTAIARSAQGIVEVGGQCCALQAFCKIKSRASLSRPARGELIGARRRPSPNDRPAAPKTTINKSWPRSGPRQCSRQCRRQVRKHHQQIRGPRQAHVSAHVSAQVNSTSAANKSWPMSGPIRHQQDQ